MIKSPEIKVNPDVLKTLNIEKKGIGTLSRGQK
jgi:hypothetical protein